jgi:predicted ATPase
MLRVVISGGPGAGKTTLLSELGRRGFQTVEESARTIIAERRAAGLSPRPAPLAFAEEILRRDIEKFERVRASPGWVFFDRSVLEAMGMLQEACAERQHDIERLFAEYRFHELVFILPPWEAIHRTDSERDQTFAQAVVVHDSIVRWYQRLGYTVNTVPRWPVEERAEHVLRVLSESDL